MTPPAENKRKTIHLPKKGGLSFWGFGHCQGSRGIGEMVADIYDVDIIFDDVPDVAEIQKRPRRTKRKPQKTKSSKQ